MRLHRLIMAGIIGLILPQSIQSQQPPPKITGQVIDSDGKPVAEADVAVWWNANSGKMQPFRGVKTDKDGNFSLSAEGAFGNPILVLDKERKTGAVKLWKAESPTLNFQLGPLVKVHGSVFSKELNKLPSWITVSIRLNYFPYPRVAECRPKEKGFVFSLPAGEYTLSVEGSDVEELRKSFIVSEEKPDLDLKEVNLVPTALTRLNGRPAPAWTITAARRAKKDIKLSDLKGKWVLIVFWAAGFVTTTNFELPNLVDLYEGRAKDRDKFEIIAFHDPSVKDFKGLDERLQVAKEWYWRRDLPFPVLLDSTGQTLKDFGIRGLPTMLLIDPENKVFGPVRQEKFEEKLPELALEARIKIALDKRISPYFDDPPLDRALQILSEQANISIRSDKGKLEAEGQTTDMIMPIKLDNGFLSLRSALNLLLDGMELTYEQDNKGIIVRPRKIAGQGPKQISETQQASAKRIEKMLNERVTFNFPEMPLGSLTVYFRGIKQENFILEPADRRAHLLNIYTKISGSAKDARLGEALTELLRPYKMSFEVRDEVVVLKYKAP
jgi:hypothetical protein